MPVCFPDTFLDYLPDPPMGRAAYREALEESFAADRAEVPPLYALLKVTNRCASHCAYCAHAGVTNRDGEASTAVLTGVLEQLALAGAVSVNFTGGEPLQRDDLPELVRRARGLGLFPILLTNGLLLRRRLRQLKNAGLGMVIVSVDSIRPDEYRATRGADLGRVLGGIDALAALPDDQRPTITVTVVVNAHNVHRLDEIVTYFSDRGIGVKLCPYHHHGRWEDDCLSPRDTVLYEDAVAKLKHLKRAGAGILDSEAYLDGFVPFTFRRELPSGFRCYCGYTTLYIDAELNVRSCWSQGLPVAGNLHDQPLARLLRTARIKRMRKKIRNLECERCWLLCTAEISLRWQ